MRRREFIVAVGAAAAWPLSAATQPAKTHTIGILVLGNPDPAPFLGVVRAELAKLGYEDGRNARFEVRSAAGNAAQLPALAAELAGLPVDVLITFQTPPTIAARDATKTVPI